MTPGNYLAKLISFPELQLVLANGSSRPGWLILTLESVSKLRACPRCAALCEKTYDHRWVSCRDSAFRDKKVVLRIHKKRYFCQICRKPFMELLHGIFKRARFTERFRRHVLWCCSRYQSLLGVSRAIGCSPTTVRRSFYSHLQIHFKRHLNYEFPKKLGIDEHFFGMRKKADFPAVSEQKYHTTLVDLKAHRLYRALPEKDQKSVFDQLKTQPGAENVEDMTMDMSEGYRNVTRALFPNARITVDPFHVLRLLQRSLNHERHKLIGKRKKKNPLSYLLLKSSHDLDLRTRWRIQDFLKAHSKLREIYEFKERLHTLYRCRGRWRAEKSMNRILSDLQNRFHIQALKTLHKTLSRWKEEILNHFSSGLTNAMTEGFNNKIKLIKRMAYGFRNPEIYNLRILYACYH